MTHHSLFTHFSYNFHILFTRFSYTFGSFFVCMSVCENYTFRTSNTLFVHFCVLFIHFSWFGRHVYGFRAFLSAPLFLLNIQASKKVISLHIRRTRDSSYTLGDAYNLEFAYGNNFIWRIAPNWTLVNRIKPIRKINQYS